MDPTPAPPANPTPPAPPANPEPTPTPPPAISPDGKLGENWHLALGDEFATKAADLSKYTDIRDLIHQYHYFQTNGASYPTDPNDARGIERFRKIAGVPESPDGYGLTAETMKLPEGMEFDTELASAVAAAAHAAHAPPAAVAAIAGVFNDVIAKRHTAAIEEAKQARAASLDALVKEWGGNYETNASIVRHTASVFAEKSGIAPDDPAFASLLDNPAFARVMLNVSKLSAEDPTRAPAGFGDLRSPAQKIKDIREGRDPEWSAKMNSRDENQRLEAYEHIRRLEEQAAR
jgi:hypothetical protein